MFAAFDHAMDVFCQADNHARVANGDDYAADFAADRVVFQKEVDRERFRPYQNDGGGVFAAVFEDGHDADVDTFTFFEHLMRIDAFAVDVIPSLAFLIENVCNAETDAVVFNAAYSSLKNRVDSKAASEVTCFHI